MLQMHSAVCLWNVTYLCQMLLKAANVFINTDHIDIKSVVEKYIWVSIVYRYKSCGETKL